MAFLCISTLSLEHCWWYSQAAELCFALRLRKDMSQRSWKHHVGEVKLKPDGMCHKRCLERTADMNAFAIRRREFIYRVYCRLHCHCQTPVPTSTEKSGGRVSQARTNMSPGPFFAVKQQCVLNLKVGQPLYFKKLELSMLYCYVSGWVMGDSV